MILCAILAILLLNQLLEHTECQRRFCCRTRLGDDVYGDILALADREYLVQISRIDVVADIVDIRCIFLQVVVERRFQKLDGSTGTQIRTADTDDDQDIRIALDLLGSSLNPCEFFLVIIGGQGEPAQEVRTESGLAVQHLCCRFHLMLDSGEFVFPNKFCQILCIQLYRHNTIPSPF